MLFKNFPEDPSLYKEDLKDMVTKTVERHGSKEWRAAVLTNELHGHLGIYAIVGVKMGIKALEYLGETVGHVSVQSSAGMRPPISCLNDGLQVSTEATFGHGLIASEATDKPLPEAAFTTEGGKKIHIKIRDEEIAMIRKEIAWARAEYELTPPYWNYVRELAIRYWYEMDRNEIFDIKEI